MHELSVACEMARQIEVIAARESATRVASVRVAVGAMSGVEPEALRFAFPLAMEGTVAAGAELVIDEVPFTVHCRDCRMESAPEDEFALCPACGSSDVEVRGGRELHILSLDVL